jgi:ABC-type multidrug transport system fused ATPase/permease subunit
MAAVTSSERARPETLRRGAAMYRSHLSRHPGLFAIAVAGAAVFAVCTVASSFVLRWVIDEVIVPRFEEGEVATSTVAAGCAAIVLVGVVRAAGVVVRRTWAGKTSYFVKASIQDDVIQRYQEQPLAWHLAHGTGELASHAGVDADATTDALAPLPYSTAVVVMLVVSTVWMLATDVVLGLVAMALFPLLAGLNIVYQRLVDRPATVAQDRLGEVTGIVHESLDGITVVKALGAEAHEAARLEAKAAELRTAKIEVATMRATFESLLDGVPGVANAILVVIGAMRVDAGAATLGEVVSFVYLFTLLVWPLRLIGWLLGDLAHSLAGYDRIQGVMAEPVLPPPRASLTTPVRGIGLALAGVRFAYADGRRALDGVDLEVVEGRIVALVGPTGSGKTTLLQVVDGLIAPDNGVVAVPEGDRALVFQEPFLFADTLRENVLLGLEVGDDELARALELAQAAEFVGELPQGLDTRVGERGVSLSGGQRQRIALARALVRRPRTLLLDDATSSLDPTTEARILAALHTELAGVTTLMVATRPSTIALADEVVYLGAGRVVGRGSHGELYASLPAYRNLVDAYERDRRTP